MTAPSALGAIPDDTPVSLIVGSGSMTMGELRAAITQTGPIYITTREASRRYSRSQDWWAEAAKDIPGAYKDRLWRLPVAGCEAHLAALTRPRRRKRGPWHPRTEIPPAETP